MRRQLIGLIAAGLAMGPGLAIADTVQGGSQSTGQNGQTSLALSDLGDANAGLPPTVDGSSPGETTEAMTGYVGGVAIAAANKDLEEHGHPGGLEAQGIDSSQITSAMKFDGVMPQAATTMTNGVLSSSGLPNLTDFPGMSMLK